MNRSLLVNSLIMLVCIVSSGCNTPAYDPDNPDEYVEYWCDPVHRNSAIPPDQEWRNGLNYDTDEAYRQGCLDQYNLRAR